MGMIQVTNKNQEVFSDMYDGVRYTFEPGVATVMEEAAAQHIFGYGLDQEGQIKKFERVGWLKDRSEAELRRVWVKFNNFVFREVEPNWKETVVEPISKEADSKSGKQAGRTA